MAVLVRNGVAASPWHLGDRQRLECVRLSKQELLQNFSGAYTTARTVSRSSIFELSMHCQRRLDTSWAHVSPPQAGGHRSQRAREEVGRYA